MADPNSIAVSMNAEVYPNPTDGKITVQFNSTTDKQFNISLTDYEGRLIFEKAGVAVSGENKLEFDLAALARGVYFVKVISDDELNVFV